MDSSVDYERLVDNVRTQSKSAPGSDTERVTIRSLDDVSADALRTLLEALEGEDVEPGALEFHLSSANAERLLEGEGEGDDADDVEALEDRLGRPVRTDEGMPDDAILLFDPDAVDTDGEIGRPDAIACGMVGEAR